VTKCRGSLPPAFTLVSCSNYSSTLKMETCSSETSIEFQKATRHYIPEDMNLHERMADSAITYNSNRRRIDVINTTFAFSQ
jgi:hypothetical protein